MSQGTITPKELSMRLGLKPDGKALRRFMRKLADDATMENGTPIVPRVGQGNRYGMSAQQAERIARAWRKAHGIAEPVARKPRKAAHAASVIVEGNVEGNVSADA